jgi:hypothetical protein
VPTFERLPRFDREFRRMPRELQRAFLAMLPVFIAALRVDPPAFPPTLRVKRVQGHDPLVEDDVGAGASSSGPWRTRTSNLGIKSPLLYQLS